MDDRHIPSIDELYAGRMKDGSSPVLQSGKLYDHWDKPLPGIDETKTKSQITAEELHHQVDLVLLDDLDLIRDFAIANIKAAQQIAEADNPACRRRESEAGQTNQQPANTEADSNVSPGQFAKQTDRFGGEDVPCKASEPSVADADDTSARHASAGPSAAPASHAPTDSQPLPTQPHKGPGLASRADGEGIPGKAGIPIPNMPGMPGMPNPRAPREAGYGGVKIPDPPQDIPLEKFQTEQRNAEFQARVIKATSGQRQRKSPEPIVSVLTKPQALAFAERCSRLLLAVTDKRAAVAHKLVDSALTVDMKTSFMWDRAHGVVAATLLHMSETFDKLGFGAWMPFRYPDQWLMFCGIMQRVLAANGLIHSKHADIYRKLLDETPPVEWPEGIEDTQERIEKLKTPENWARCWINRGARTLTIMKQRLEDEVWNKPPPP